MNILDGVKLDFDDVMILPKRSDSEIESREDIDITRTFKFRHSKKTWTGIPIISSNMDSTGTINMAVELYKHNMLTALHKFYPVDKLVEFFSHGNQNQLGIHDYVFYTTGISEKDLAKLDNITKIVRARTWDGIDVYKDFPRMISVDIANGYTKKFSDTVKKIREKYPLATIMAGNVVTPNMVEQLIQECGVDIVKVGLGSGSACLTRIVAGVGYPQFSAIIECKDAAHGMGGLICSDGGCRIPADVVKAFSGGSDFVMLGGMFAGTDECEGDWEYDEEQLKKDGLQYTFVANGFGKNVLTMNSTDEDIYTKYKKSFKFYGMSSKEAQEKYYGKYQKHRASEGRVASIPYKGPVEDILHEITGGIRSCCAYTGSVKLKDLDKCATFVRCNRTHNTIYER